MDDWLSNLFCIIISLIFGICIGIGIGRGIMEKEAIKNGAAQYTVDSQSGRVSFEWKGN